MGRTCHHIGIRLKSVLAGGAICIQAPVALCVDHFVLKYRRELRTKSLNHAEHVPDKQVSC